MSKDNMEEQAAVHPVWGSDNEAIKAEFRALQAQRDKYLSWFQKADADLERLHFDVEEREARLKADNDRLREGWKLRGHKLNESRARIEHLRHVVNRAIEGDSRDLLKLELWKDGQSDIRASLLDSGEEEKCPECGGSRSGLTPFFCGVCKGSGRAALSVMGSGKVEVDREEAKAMLAFIEGKSWERIPPKDWSLLRDEFGPRLRAVLEQEGGEA